MKKILTLLFAQFFNWFKIKSPVVYGTIIAPALVWLQTQLMDPVIIQEITEAIPDAPSIIVKIIKMLPTILLALTAPHSSDIVNTSKRNRDGRL